MSRSSIERATLISVLELGAGLGYQAAVLARVAREVWSVEPELAEAAADNLAARGVANVHDRAMPLARLMNALLFHPAREILATPPVPYEDLTIGRLHGWWVPATAPAIGQVLLFHGNAGNIGDRVPHVALLSAAGFDVLAFDYSGYGQSEGRPSERATYEDARAAVRALRNPTRVIYLGESLGGAVALRLAIERPPAGLILQSTFTSVRHMARLHYPIVPRALVPDAYPSLDIIRGLRAPLLVLHGAGDEIVPLMDGQALYEAAPGPKRIEVFEAGHNDLVSLAGSRWIRAITGWAAEL